MTNNGAVAALATLRGISGQLTTTENQASSGLRVSSAKDNAAYWSISTTMRSDRGAVSAANDALGLGDATVGVAYDAMDETLTVLNQIKGKLVSASESSTDKSKIQEEIGKLAKQTQTIAQSASFNGVNLLDTDIDDLYDADLDDRSAEAVASFTRAADGSTTIGTIGIDQLKTSLYNADGGGILESDPRSPQTIGGIRGASYLSDTTYNTGSATAGDEGIVGYTWTAPITFSTASDAITFNLTVDTENPGDPIDPPYAAGKTTAVTIDRSVVDAVLPGNNGTINNNLEYVAVLNQALAGTGASAGWSYKDYPPVIDYDHFEIHTDENRTLTGGLNGSYVSVANLSSTVGTGGLTNAADFGDRGSSLDMAFTPFQVYKDVKIDFDFNFNEETPVHLTIDRDLVDSVLGTSDGKINSSDDMVKILKTLITRPDTIIAANGASGITLATDPAVDRLSGAQTGVFFRNVSVNIEPIPQIGLQQMDVEQNPDMVPSYLSNLELMIQRVTNGASMLGSVKARIETQEQFAQSLMDTLDSGVGKLVDADMEETSSRLTALQTQQQLATQSLQIANSAPRSIMTLFNN